MRSRMRVCAAACLVWTAIADISQGATVLTRDGKVHAGKVEFRADQQVRVMPAGGEAVTFAWKEIARINMVDPLTSSDESVHRDPALPMPWQQADIGAVKHPGNGSETGGVFTVQGAGWGLWGREDSCHFVYQHRAGDVDMSVRLGALPTEENAFVAGLCVRDGIDARAAQASVMMFPGGVVRMSCRPVSGSVESAPPAGDQPYQWLRLARTGDRFSGFCSRDGQNWVLVGTVTAKMGPIPSVGMACATTLNHALLGTRFDHLKLTSESMGPPEGIGLVDGSLIAGRLKRLDAQELEYIDATGRGRKIPANAVACFFTRPLPSDVRCTLATRAPGIRLTTGDEIEGTIQGCRGGVVNVVSLLFGPQNAPLAKVLLAVLRPTRAGSVFHLGTRDGSIYRCTNVAVQEGMVIAEGGALESVQVRPEDLSEVDLRAGP